MYPPLNLQVVAIAGWVLMITRVREHGGMTQMTARLPFHHGIIVSLVVELVGTAPISTIMSIFQKQNGIITLVAGLDYLLYVSLNSPMTTAGCSVNFTKNQAIFQCTKSYIPNCH